MAVRTNRAVWQEQLSDIMEALARAAVAEICGVMDDGYALLNMEITRKDKENQDLKTKLHLIESIVARGSGNDSWKKAGAIGEEPGGGPPVGEGRTVFQHPETEPYEREREGGRTADAPGGNGAADDVVLREELPDVVLIKDEDSDCDEAFEGDMKAAADGEVAPIGRGMKRNWSRDPKLKSSPDSLTVKKTPKVTAHTLTHTPTAHTLAHTPTAHTLTQTAHTLTHTPTAHTLAHTQTPHTLTHTQNAHTLTQKNTQSNTQTAHTLAHTQTPHTLTHSQKNTQSNTPNAHTLTHTQTPHTLTLTQKNTQSNTQAHTLTHTLSNTQSNTLTHTQNNPIYTLDSPRSEPGCSENMDAFSDSDDVQELPFFAPNPNTTNTRQTSSYLNNNNNNSAASMESQSPSNRAEINLNLTWTKQSTDENHVTSTFTQKNMDAVEVDSDNDAFGLKLVSVSGSTTLTDCHVSENSSNSAFEYEDNTTDIMSCNGLYREQLGRPQSNTNRGKRFVCSICSRTYATHQNLEVHMRIHTGEKPFCCSHCGKKFNQSAHLKTHLSVHTGERPYACSMCSRSFIVRYSLKLHMKKCHNNNV